MKKAFLWGGVMLIMLALAGCDEVKDILVGEEPDGPTKTGETPGNSWDKFLDDFDAKAGTEPGEIQYKFSSIDSSNTAVYTLYYATAGVNKADLLIAAATKADQTITVTPQTSYTLLTGGQFAPGKSYSMVVEAKKGNAVARSAVLPQVKATDGPPQIELTVTGIPTNAGIVAASLLGNDGQPVAIATKIGDKFAFYKYTETTTGTPTLGAAWTQTGSYYIALVNGLSVAQVTAQYTYIKGQYNFTEATASLTWNDFKEDTQLALIISDIPTGTQIVAAMLFDQIPTGLISSPKAVGTNFGGVFKFSTYTQGQLGGNYKTQGAYYIFLATNLDGSGTNYTYIGTGQTPSQYTFTQQQTTANIEWSKFVAQQ